MEAVHVEFSPAVNGNQGKSLPLRRYFFDKKYRTETEENEKSKYDIGLLELEKDLLEDYGYVGIDTQKDNIKSGEEEIEICGYPRYKDEPMMWTTTGKAIQVDENFIYSQITTSVGQSGSPIIKIMEGDEYIVGFHIGGQSKKKRNTGMRLTEEKRIIISGWMEEIMQEVKFPESNQQWRELEWNDGSWYEGEYKNGKYNGRGVYYHYNGNKYEGEFKDGRSNGKGVAYDSDGNKYEGEFKNGRLHGQGVEYQSNGDRYEGDFKDGQKNGKGVYYKSNGKKY